MFFKKKKKPRPVRLFIFERQDISGQYLCYAKSPGEAWLRLKASHLFNNKKENWKLVKGFKLETFEMLVDTEAVLINSKP